MFVITGAYVEAKDEHDNIAANAPDGIGRIGVELEVSLAGFRGATRVERIIGRAFGEVGASVTMTTATDFAAFWVGIFSTIPVIRSFCYYCAICVLTDFLWQSTFFIALLSLDARREMAGRVDCCCCVQANGAVPEVAVAYAPGETPKLPRRRSVQPDGAMSRRQTARVVANTTLRRRSSVGLPTNKVAVAPSDEAPTPSAAAHAPESAGSYSPTTMLLNVVLSPKGRVGILVTAAITFMVGGFGCTKVGYGFASTDLFKKTSYLQAWYPALEEYFLKDDSVAMLMTKGQAQGLNYSTVESQLGLIELTQEWNEFNVDKNGGTKLYSWYETFLEFVEETDQEALAPEGVVKPAKFYGLLQEFLKSPILGDLHQKLIALDRSYDSCALDDTWVCAIQSTIMLGTAAPASEFSKVAEYVVEARALVEKHTTIPAIIFVPSVMFKSSLNDAIASEIGSTVLGAVVAVTVCSLVFLTSVRSAAIVTISIMMIDVELVGLMAFLGITLSPISLVCIIMSIGLSFDYVAHIAHAFMHAHVDSDIAANAPSGQAQRESRIALAIMEVGAAISQSAASTMLGLSFLSLAGSAMFGTMYVSGHLPMPPRLPTVLMQSFSCSQTHPADCSRFVLRYVVFVLALMLAVIHGYLVIPVRPCLPAACHSRVVALTNISYRMTRCC